MKEARKMFEQQNPLIVMWEMTRNCNLKCLHCQLKTKQERESDELTFAEGRRLIDEVAEMDHPLLILTGGNVFTRPDFFELAQYGIAKGLKLVIATTATEYVTEENMYKTKEIGISRWDLYLDGADIHSHDSLCGVSGTFELTLRSLEYLKKIGMPRQVNTIVSKINYDKIEELGNLIKSLNISFWNTIMMVPTPGNQEIASLTACEQELFFQWLYDYSKKVPFKVKTTYGQHFQRVVIQNKARQLHMNPYTVEFQNALRQGATAMRKLLNYNPYMLNNDKETIFISHNGDVYPNRIMPIKAGNVKDESLQVIYRFSPLFKKLKNPDLLKGKCGICEYRYVCGGSRSRAYNLTGDYLETDPNCIYMPKKAYHLQEKVLAK